jgi:exopolysaccharide/PEP-CTERM locus tyrosine autokinase
VSLVEQAMSRMRRPGGVESLEKTDALPSPGGAATLSQPVDAAPPSPKRLTVEINALRAGGYLPEEEKDRQFADHYRHIKRPLIQKALADNAGAAADPRLIMVTSALPGDGKTFTSINLAFSLARERDISVLLVDADLLKPHVSKIFGLQQAPGLTDALVDEAVPVESLVVATNVRGFSILPAGAPAEGTAELLSSNRMRQIVTSLCTQDPRRIVLLDSPPLLITSEGPALANIAGQVVLVVRAGQTPQRAVLDAIGLIDTQRAGGIVLNEAHIGVMHGYYGYGLYGSYGDAASPKR